MLPLGSANISGVDVDPRRRLLIRRARGDTARFALEPGQAKGAESVRLEGPFLDGPLAAFRGEDGRWTAAVELSEGIYPYWWSVDGQATDARWLEVEPRIAVSDAAFGGGFPGPERESP